MTGFSSVEGNLSGSTVEGNSGLSVEGNSVTGSSAVVGNSVTGSSSSRPSVRRELLKEGVAEVVGGTLVDVLGGSLTPKCTTRTPETRC